MLQNVWEKMCTDFGRGEAPSALYVPYLVKKVQETCILIDKPKCEKPKTVRIPDNIADVAEIKSTTSIHRHSQQLNISETSLRRILHKDLDITAYKVQLIQGLKLIYHTMRFRFAKWACDRLTEDADFGKKKTSFQMKHLLILASIEIIKFFIEENPERTLRK